MDRDARIEAALSSLIGKTIAAASHAEGEKGDHLALTTTDGAEVRLRTRDASHFDSWLELDDMPQPDAGA